MRFDRILGRLNCLGHGPDYMGFNTAQEREKEARLGTLPSTTELWAA